MCAVDNACCTYTQKNNQEFPARHTHTHTVAVFIGAVVRAHPLLSRPITFFSILFYVVFMGAVDDSGGHLSSTCFQSNLGYWTTTLLLCLLQYTSPRAHKSVRGLAPPEGATTVALYHFDGSSSFLSGDAGKTKNRLSYQ